MRCITSFAFLLTALGAAQRIDAGEQEPQPLACHAGPAKKMFGGSQWLAYACDDGRSVVVSDQGNPAMPFVFMFNVKEDGGFQLYGEGEGSKEYTQSAFDELRKLDDAGVAALAAEARAAKPAQ